MRVLDDWLLTSARVAIHLPSATAVVADLHLGYDEARCRSGEAVPVRPIDVILQPLGDILYRTGIHRVVVAGDLMEDGDSRNVLDGFLGWLDRRNTELVAVVPGNHDRDLAEESNQTEVRQGRGLILATSGFQLDEWQVIHGDGPKPDGPVVQGHEHPAFRCSDRIVAPCYLFTDKHLVLPAYSPDAAGVNIVGVRRWRDYCCAVIVGDRVLDFGPVAGMSRRLIQKAKRGRG